MYIDSINTSPSEMLDISSLRIFEYFVRGFGTDDRFQKIQFNDDSHKNIFARVKQQYYPIENVSSVAHIKIA